VSATIADSEIRNLLLAQGDQALELLNRMRKCADGSEVALTDASPPDID
jgi:hypothetical protein